MPRFSCIRCSKTLSAAQSLKEAPAQDAVDVPEERMYEFVREGAGAGARRRRGAVPGLRAGQRT